MSTPMLSLHVADVVEVRGAIRTLRLTSDDGRSLPGFPPGSHIGLQWRDGRSNFYSLTNDGHAPDAYQVAVLRRDGGDGGSRWVHELRVGDVVRATPPRSGFSPAAVGRHHVLVSGGVGITPILSHARWHQAWGNPFEVWHVGPDNEILAELRSIAAGSLSAFEHRAEFWAALTPRLRSAPFGSHVYTCGPTAMIAGVEQAAIDSGWVKDRVHAESFEAAPVHGEPFVAIAQRSGLRVAVDGETSLLLALEAADITVPSMCRNGVCGKCLTTVVSGRVDHQDSYLDATEREAHSVMMPCVSRALDKELVLDL